MKKNLKKAMALFLSLALSAAALSGCAGSPSGSAPAANSQGASSGAASASGPQYNGNDISQHADLVMYVIGDQPKDEAAVMGEINKILEEKINASISLKYMALSDYTQKYSLKIASGEKFDLIYTSAWAMYSQEAAKGAFAEVTDEVISNYMPLTKENQAPESFKQAQIDGKAYFVPVNMANVAGNAILIRGDLREKYGLEPIKTVDDLEAYYTKIAENEKGIFPYAASQHNNLLKMVIFQGATDYMQVPGLEDYFTYKYADSITGADVKWIYDMPEYVEFANRMKTWADKGFWSKNAVANATDPKDAYLNGTSASYSQNLGTCGVVASTVAKDHPDWKPEIVDVTPDATRALGSYIGDGMAVLDSSDNQARAFMALDLLKFDQQCYDLVRLGIEGTHWNDEGTDAATGHGLWSPADKQADWSFGNAPSWGLKNNDFERTRTDTFPDQTALKNAWEAGAKVSPTATFSFDNTPIKNEKANLDNIKTKYMPLLDLGLTNDVAATLAEFQQQAKQAGLEKIMSEVQTQIDAMNAAK